MSIVSMLGSSIAYATILPFAFNCICKPANLYFWCAIPFCNYAMNQCKSLYAEPRPYWITDEFTANHCLTGFGNPSGHMFNNCFFWATLYLHFFYEVNQPPASMSSLKFVATLVFIAAIPLMALSRVTMGAHTLNEVLFGTLIGITFAWIGHYKVKPLFL